MSSNALQLKWRKNGSKRALTGEKSRTMLQRVAEAVMRTSRSGSSRRRKRGVDTSWSTMLPRSDLALRDRLRTHMHAASRTCAHMPSPCPIFLSVTIERLLMMTQDTRT